MKKITDEHLEIYKGAYRLAMLDPLRSNATMHFDYCMKAALQAVFDSFQDSFRDMITLEALMEILNRFELDNTLSNRCKAKGALEVIFNFHLRDIAPSSDNSAQLTQSAEPLYLNTIPFGKISLHDGKNNHTTTLPAGTIKAGERYNVTISDGKAKIEPINAENAQPVQGKAEPKEWEQALSKAMRSPVAYNPRLDKSTTFKHCQCFGTTFKSKEINGAFYGVCTVCDLPQNPKTVSAQPKPKQSYTRADMLQERRDEEEARRVEEDTPTLLEEMDIEAGYKGELLPKDAAMRREVYQNVSEYLVKYMQVKNNG